MTQADRDYFERRSVEERQAADRAADAKVAATHRELADRYEALVASYLKIEQVKVRAIGASPAVMQSERSGGAYYPDRKAG
jgi:hypothetical protein